MMVVSARIKNGLVALASMLGGGLFVAVAAVVPFLRDFLFNYHQFWGPSYGSLVSVLAFYLLGVYLTAVLLRQIYSNSLRTFEPSFLVMGNAVGLLIAISLMNCLAWTFSGSWVLGAYLLSFLFVLLCTGLAGSIKRQKGARRRYILLRWLVPVVLIATTLHSSLLVTFAPAEVRQRWAYTEFSDYGYVMDSIRQCPAITGRIASIKTVAPAQGRNFTIYDPGSSGHQGEFTLEIIGPIDSGIAHSEFHIGTNLYAVQFTHSGKTEMLTCPNPR